VDVYNLIAFYGQKNIPTQQEKKKDYSWFLGAQQNQSR